MYITDISLTYPTNRFEPYYVKTVEDKGYYSTEKLWEVRDPRAVTVFESFLHQSFEARALYSNTLARLIGEPSMVSFIEAAPFYTWMEQLGWVEVEESLRRS